MLNGQWHLERRIIYMVFTELVNVNSNVWFVYFGLMIRRRSAETSAAAGQGSEIILTLPFSILPI